MTRFQLDDETRDMRRIEADLRRLGIDLDDTDISTHLLLSLSGELDRSARELLDDLGVKVLEQVDRQTYIARFAGASLSLVRGLDFVTWTVPMHWRFKLDSELLAARDRSREQAFDERLAVQVTLHTDAHGEPLPEVLARARRPSNRSHRLELDIDEIEQLARSESVRSVTCRPKDQDTAPGELSQADQG